MGKAAGDGGQRWDRWHRGRPTAQREQMVALHGGSAVRRVLCDASCMLTATGGGQSGGQPGGGAAAAPERWAHKPRGAWSLKQDYVLGLPK